MYDVVVNSTVPTNTLSLQTVFSCRMVIPGTEFSLKEEIMYLHEDIRTSASHLLNAAGWERGTNLLPLIVLLLFP